MTALFSTPKIPEVDQTYQQKAEQRAEDQQNKLDKETSAQLAALSGRNRGRALLVTKSTGETGVSDTLG